MTPHQVLSMMTQEQTQDLLVACLAYLTPERVHAALLEGFEARERHLLWALLMKESELEVGDSSP